MADLSASERAHLDSTHPTRILARSMYKRLVSEGYDERKIVAFATELIALLAASLRARNGSQGSSYANEAADGAAPAGAEVSPPTAAQTTGAPDSAGRTESKRAHPVIAFLVLALIAHGCGNSDRAGTGSCSALCANQPVCLQSSGEDCITTCRQQESLCKSSNHSAEFQAFVDCASGLSSAAYACGSRGPQTTQCGEEALTLLECGPADDGGPKSGTPDATTTPTNDRAPYIPFYDGGMAAVTPCYADQAFTAIPWAPPTPLHQNRCTAGQISTYLNTLNGDGPFTSGSASCDACLQTDVGAASHGPVVVSSQGTMSAPIELNWGGCLANLDGMMAPGSCGNTFNDAGDCLIAQCNTCPDFSSNGPTNEACTMLARSAGGRCTGETTTTACAAEIETGGIAEACGSTFTSLLTIWCGP